MNITEAIILGIVQGLTEFFPISSSGHLLFIPILLEQCGLQADFSFQTTSFDVSLHIATFLAILICYRAKLKQILFGAYKGEGEQKSFLFKLILGSIPALSIGLLFFVIGDELL